MMSSRPLLGATNPQGNVNYGSTTSPAQSGGSEGYEEFFGGSIACPTCRGVGRIPREKENEMVALIPFSDKRLKPRRTTCYVLLAVLICLLIGGLLLFFLFPRNISLLSDSPTLRPTYLYINTTEEYMYLTVLSQYNISNENFFQAKIQQLSVQVLFDQKVIGMMTNNTVLSVPPRQTTPHYIEMNVTLKGDEGYLTHYCAQASHRAHTLLFPFQATLKYTCLGRPEEATLNTFQHVWCSRPKALHR